MSHVRAQHMGVHLNDFSLHIASGEIVGLIGIHGSGAQVVSAVLEGRARVAAGSVSIQGRRISRISPGFPEIYCIDRTQKLSAVLTISENIFGLHWKDSPTLVERTLRNHRRARALLREVDLARPPYCKISELEPIERCLLHLAIARMRGVRMLILNCFGCSYSPYDYAELSRHILRLRGEGVSVLIIDDQPNPLLEKAERVVYIRHGVNLRTIYDTSPATLLSYLAPSGQYVADSAGAAPPGQAVFPVLDRNGLPVFTVRRKMVIGVFDVGWSVNESMPDYLQSMLRRNHLHLPLRLRGAGDLRRQGIVYIPENSAERLVEHMTLEYNLSAAAHRRISGPLGIVNRRMQRFVYEEFLRRFGIAGCPDRVSELRALHRKIVSVHRWELTAPSVYLLENPMLHIGIGDRPDFGRYIRELAQADACVVFSSKDIGELYSLCDCIALLKNKRLRRLLYPEDYGRTDYAEI